jgi:DNA-binding NarL/FixJ family response regulator
MRLVLVEDHAAYRESFALALSSLHGFEVVGQAERARDAFGAIAESSPDLVVCDFMLPDTDAVSMVRELRRRRLRVRSMILARIGHPLFVRDALRAGVGGYALKRAPLQDLCAAMTHVAAGETYLSPELRQLSPGGDVAAESPLGRLSAREREIFCLLVEGGSTKDIAAALFLSPKTVDAHRLHINRKLGVRSSAELTRLVAGEGFIVA